MLNGQQRVNKLLIQLTKSEDMVIIVVSYKDLSLDQHFCYIYIYGESGFMCISTVIITFQHVPKLH